MIKAILISAILFLSYAYFCDTLKVTLKHSPYQNNKSTIEMNCFGNYDKKEALANLTITKDGKQFYSYDNRTKRAILTPVPGIPVNSIQYVSGPGHFVMTRINKTTSGNYNCTIYSNKTRGSDRAYISVNGSNMLSNHLILPIVMVIISIFK